MAMKSSAAERSESLGRVFGRVMGDRTIIASAYGAAYSHALWENESGKFGSIL